MFVASDGVHRTTKESSGGHLIDFGCEHGPTATFFNRANNLYEAYTGLPCGTYLAEEIAFVLKDIQIWLLIIFNVKSIISVNKI
jgi:hypothetical protein